jgi:phage-related protein (TIGR01555 family)
LSNTLSDEEAEALYAQDDIAARVCDTMPEYALRKGIEVKITPDKEQETGDLEGDLAEVKELETDVASEFKRLDVVANYVDCGVWANVFGACSLLIGGADGARGDALKEPLNEDNIQAITHLNIIDKRYITPVRWYDDPESEKFGKPETYLITPQGQAGQSVTQLAADPLAHEIHESRFILFGGVRTSIRRRQQNKGWEDSLLQRMQTVLSQFGTSWDALPHLITDANQGVFKMWGLIDALAAEEPSTIQTRMELLDMSRSVVRAVVLDAENEDFQRQNFSWAGIEKPFELLMYRLSAAARQPVSVIMGRAPAGMNATGEHDERNFYDQVEAYRSGEMLKNLEKLVRLIFKAKNGPTNGQEPENWEVKYPSLWTMTPKEEAEIYDLTAKGDKANVEAGILLPEEIALSRYGPEGKSEIAIDLNARIMPDETEQAEPAQIEPVQEEPSDEGSE